jgi:hypothetical protein
VVIVKKSIPYALVIELRFLGRPASSTVVIEVTTPGHCESFGGNYSSVYKIQFLLLLPEYDKSGDRYITTEISLGNVIVMHHICTARAACTVSESANVSLSPAVVIFFASTYVKKLLEPSVLNVFNTGCFDGRSGINTQRSIHQLI